MTKVVLDDVGYVPTSAATINNNNTLIEQAVENTLSRDGTGPNEMNANLDMNSNRIINLPYPNTPLEPMRKTDVAILLEEMKDEFEGPQGPPGQDVVLDYASEVEAILGVDNTKVMTPFTTKTSVVAHRGAVLADDLGAEGDGSDEKAALEAAFAKAVSTNTVFKTSPGKVYTVSTLNIPDDLVIDGPLTISRQGTIPARQTFINIGKRVTADELYFYFDGSEQGSIAAAALVRADEDFTCGTLSLTSAVQLGYPDSINGFISNGIRTRIYHPKFKNLDYGIVLVSPSTTVRSDGSYIGVIEMESYLRAFYAQFCSFKCEGIRAIGRSPNAALLGSDGENGRYQSNLYEGCSDFEMGDIYMVDCGHGVRIGGSPHANAVTRNGRFGNIYVEGTRGCAFKINTTRTVSTGVTEKAYNIIVGDITSVDGADGTYEGNREFIRLSHVSGIKLGQCRALLRDQTNSHQSGLLLNDVDGLEIDSLHGENFNAGFVTISGTADAPTFPGDVKNVTIGRVTGKMAGSNAITVDSALNYGDISICLDNITGFTRVFAWFTSGTLTGNFNLYGRVGGAVAPVYLNAPSDSRFRLDITWDSYRTLTDSALFVVSHTIPSVIGNGAKLALTGIGPNVGSTVTRGAIIEGVNTSGGSNAYDMVFYTNAASSNPMERMRINSAGVVNFATTPTVGGSNTVYHTGNLTLVGAVLQSKYTEIATVAAGSDVIPFDNTKPQITEGFQLMSNTITPGATTNKIRVRVNIPYSINTGPGTVIAALFRAGTSDALAATFEYRDNGTGGHLALVYEYTPGVTTLQTLSVRVGVAANTYGIVVNGSGASLDPIFNGASRATMVIEEIKA